MVDSNYFVALKVAKDPYHGRAEEIFADIANGLYGKLFTCDYVLDEAVTAMRVRTGSHVLAMEVANMIMNSKYVEMLYVIKEEVEAAMASYRQFEDKELSFTDWVLAKQIEYRSYAGIISFDADFDAIGISRVF